MCFLGLSKTVGNIYIFINFFLKKLKIELTLNLLSIYFFRKLTQGDVFLKYMLI